MKTRSLSKAALSVAVALAALLLAPALARASAAEPAPAAAPEGAPAEKAPPATPEPPASKGQWEYLERGLLFYPAGPGPGKDRWAVGAIWQIAPMFTADYKRGVGYGFTLDAEVQTIILYNQLGVGAEWGAKVGPFGLGVMAHFNGYFGALGKAVVQTTSFDATGWGILFDPGAKAGLQLTRDSWLTFQFEAYLNLYQAQKLGTLVLSPNAPSYMGFGASLVVEYSPKMQGVIYYGVSLYHTAANYPLWFNVEATPESEPFNPAMIWYLGLLAGYEF